MTPVDQETKVAILLQQMGPQSVDSVLENVEVNRAQQIKNRIQQLESSPLDAKAIEQVLDEFTRFFKFAIETANAESYWSHLIEDELGGAPTADSTDNNRDGPNVVPFPQPNDEPEEETVEFAYFEPGDDPIKDLNRLHPIQIATALKKETPKTIASVLSAIKQALVSSCISELPQELQGDIMSLMMTQKRLPPLVLNRLVSATLKKGLEIRQPEKPKPKPDEQVASVLRELPKNIRSRIVDHLKESNGEQIDDLQKMLYRFDDIVNYHDRSIQKILAEVEKQDLMTALQDCPEEVKEKILGNLSKRAKAALLEELEFVQKESEEIVENARQSVAMVIAKLDQANELMMAD